MRVDHLPKGFYKDIFCQVLMSLLVFATILIIYFSIVIWLPEKANADIITDINESYNLSTINTLYQQNTLGNGVSNTHEWETKQHIQKVSDVYEVDSTMILASDSCFSNNVFNREINIYYDTTVLPNGVKNKYFIENNIWKHEKKLSDEYTLVPSDITFLQTSWTNIDTIRINKPTNAIFYGNTTAYTGSLILGSYGQFSGSADFVANIGKVRLTGSNTYMELVVAKGTYLNLTSAQTVLAGTNLIYQLATPVITELENDLYNIIRFPSQAKQSGYYRINYNDDTTVTNAIEGYHLVTGYGSLFYELNEPIYSPLIEGEHYNITAPETKTTVFIAIFTLILSILAVNIVIKILTGLIGFADFGKLQFTSWFKKSKKGAEL